MVTDYSQMTLDELKADQAALNEALSTKQDTQRLINMAHGLIMTAKQQGFTKSQVQNQLSKIIDLYYGA